MRCSKIMLALSICVGLASTTVLVYKLFAIPAQWRAEHEVRVKVTDGSWRDKCSFLVMESNPDLPHRLYCNGRTCTMPRQFCDGLKKGQELELTVSTFTEPMKKPWQRTPSWRTSYYLHKGGTS